MNKEIEIPEGYEARIEGNKVIFEPKKSEDEKIRKEIIDYFYGCIKRNSKSGFRLEQYKSWIAYLEKQKEQKPAEWSKEYLEEGLRTRFAIYTYKNEDGVLYLSNVFVEEASRNKGFGTKILQATEKVAETIGAITIRLKVKRNSPANDWYRKRGYKYLTVEGEYDWLEKNLEYMKPSKPAEWSEDIRNWKNIAYYVLKEWLGIGQYLDNPALNKIAEELQKRYGSVNPVSIPQWSEEDNKAIHLACEFIRHHATKGDSIGGIDCSELINRLKSLRSQPKQEWSEEDVERLAKNRAFKSGTLKSEMIFYRQGVRDAFNYKGMRPHWKPSEEQMNELLNAVSRIATPNKVILDELYRDLKKLM